MKVIVKKPGEKQIIKDIANGDLIKSVKKIIKPGKFFGLLFNEVAGTDVAALASQEQKVLVYCKKKQDLKKDAYNFELQKNPLINFYGTVVVARIKDSSAETVDAVDLTEEDIKFFEKVAK